MDRKNLIIAGLSLSALMMLCTLVVLDRQAAAEVSVVPTGNAHLTAASVRYAQSAEVLVIIDKDSGIMRSYKLAGGGGRTIEAFPGGSIDLWTEYTRTPKKK